MGREKDLIMDVDACRFGRRPPSNEWRKTSGSPNMKDMAIAVRLHQSGDPAEAIARYQQHERAHCHDEQCSQYVKFYLPAALLCLEVSAVHDMRLLHDLVSEWIENEFALWQRFTRSNGDIIPPAARRPEPVQQWQQECATGLLTGRWPRRENPREWNVVVNHLELSIKRGQVSKREHWDGATFQGKLLAPITCVETTEGRYDYAYHECYGDPIDAVSEFYELIAVPVHIVQYQGPPGYEHVDGVQTGRRSKPKLRFTEEPGDPPYLYGTRKLRAGTHGRVGGKKTPRIEVTRSIPLPGGREVKREVIG